MQDYSFLEKIQMLINIVATSPLFLCCFMIGIATLIFFLVCIKKNIKINKWIFISIWMLLCFILLICYNSIFYNLIDNLFNNIFMALYFPNLTIYVIILLVSNIFFIYSILSKKIAKSYKIINILNSLIIDMLLVLIIDIVKSKEININNSLMIYSNPNLLILLELTSAIFVSWILLNLLITAHHKLKKYDKKSYPDMPEIIFE